MFTRKKALLINPGYNAPLFNEMYPTGSLWLLAAISRQQGWEAEVIQCVTDRVSHEEIIGKIIANPPDVIGLSLTTFQTKPVKELTRRIKEECGDIPIIAGGAHISSIPEATVETFPHVNTFIIGEGEIAWSKMLSSGSFPKGNVRGEVPNLDCLPFADYSKVKLNRYFGSSPPGDKPSMYIMASRGCNFKCEFCSKAFTAAKSATRTRRLSSGN